MNYEVLEALGQIAQEKNVDKALVIETLEIGLLSATKRRFGTSDNVEVNIDVNSGDIEVFAIKSVVKDEEIEDPALQIGLTAAREIEPGVKVNGEIRQMLRFADFGRNAIQSTKQILIQAGPGSRARENLRGLPDSDRRNHQRHRPADQPRRYSD